MTRSQLVALLDGGGELVWFPAGTDRSQIPTNTTPLFIVEPEGRAIIANQETVRRAHRRGSQVGGRILCLAPFAG